jgi:hypothetical protein
VADCCILFVLLRVLTATSSTKCTHMLAALVPVFRTVHNSTHIGEWVILYQYRTIPTAGFSQKGVRKGFIILSACNTTTVCVILPLYRGFNLTGSFAKRGMTVSFGYTPKLVRTPSRSDQESSIRTPRRTRPFWRTAVCQTFFWGGPIPDKDTFGLTKTGREDEINKPCKCNQNEWI